jgi:hypothetical protein
MPKGWFNPVISVGFTGIPSVVYLPTPSMVVINKSEPDIAMSLGLITPEISAGFIGTPAVVYLPTVSDPEFATNKSEPDTAMPIG